MKKMKKTLCNICDVVYITAVMSCGMIKAVFLKGYCQENGCRSDGSNVTLRHKHRYEIKRRN